MNILQNARLYIESKKIIKTALYLKPFLFVIGFVWDWFTLPKINSDIFIYIGPIYIFILLLLFYFRYKNFNFTLFREKLNVNYYFYSLAIVFFLGSLLSYSLIYYIKNTNFLISWPILSVIVATIILNELFSKKTGEYILFFIAVNFYFIFNIPIFLKKVDDFSFFVSQIASLIFSIIFLIIIKIQNYKEKLLSTLLAIIFPIFILIFYFTDNMPALPLYMKDDNFYLYVKKNGNNYILQNVANNNKVYSLDYIFNNVYFNIQNIQKDNNIYFYSSIISPAEVKARVSHNWQKYNPTTSNWDIIATVNYPLYGGREDGYRGYSYINNRGIGKYKIIVRAGDRVIGQKFLEIK